MMKHKTILLLAILLFGMTTASAQEIPYRPFLKEGKVWKCEQTGRTTERIGDVTAYYLQTTAFDYRIDGDTVFNGQTYKKVFKTIVFEERHLLYTDPEEAAETMNKTEYSEGGETALCNEFLREEGQKVYARRIWKEYGIDEEYLLYDFSLAKGERTSGEFPLGEIQISKIDTIAVQGQHFRRFHLEKNDGYEPLWVERVGHPGGPFLSARAMANDGTTYSILLCYEDGECIFTKDDFSNPAVTSQIETINNAEADVITFDLQGRRLPTGTFPKGIYVREGKKFVVK